MNVDYVHLFRALSQSLGRADPAAVTEMLISETVKFRDRLKQETGRILTVADTRAALDALEAHIEGKELSSRLTSEQKSLAQRYIDRLTLFKN